MKKAFKFLAPLLLLAGTALGQTTVSVTVDLKSIFSTAQASKVQACFSLVDGNGQQINNPRVTTSGVIVNTTNVCQSPDNTGHLAITLYANDAISPSGSLYQVVYVYSGTPVHGDTYQFLVADSTENLNLKTPVTQSALITPPTGDTTYARLDGGNQPFIGPITVPNIFTNSNVSGGVGNSSGGALNIKKVSSPSAIYMGRAVDSFGNTNSQLLGFNVEQMVNPTSSVNYQNSAYIGELFIPIGNTQNFTGNQIAADLAFINYGSGSFSGNSGIGIVGESWNSGPASSVLELDGVSGGCHNGSVTAGIPPQTPTGNGSVSNCRGIVGTVSNSSSGTITNAAALYANSPTNTGGGTITNAYGLFLGDQTAGVNNFAIKTGLGIVSFADKVQSNSSFYATGGSAFGTTSILSGDIMFIGGAGVATGVNQFAFQVAPTLSGTSESAAIVARADVAASTIINLNTGVHIVAPLINSGGSISEWDGLRIETSPASTTHFGVKQLGASDVNSFAGEVQTPKLTLNGGTSLTGQQGSGSQIVTNNGPVISTLQVNSSFLNSGTGFKHARVTTGSINATTRVDVTLSWPGTAFADTSYTPNCSVIETTVATGTQSLVIERIHTVNTSNIVVSVFNVTGGALTGTLACSAFHD